MLASLFLSFFLFFLRADLVALQVESPAFGPQAEIPQKYTCDGENISPPISWKDLPNGTKSLALISDDPDAPTIIWVHWVVYNLPETVSGLQEGTPKTETLDQGGIQGKTDFGTVGYGGPCPPAGPVHHYHFKLYALDTPLTLPPGATKADILMAATGHILAQSDLVGTYKRS